MRFTRSYCKNLLEVIAFSLLLLAPASAQQAVGRVVDGTIFPGLTTDLQNFIQNPSARMNATQNTATSSATLTRDTTGASDLIDGIASFICDASAQNGYCEWNTYTIPEGYKTGNCMAALQYKGDASLYRLQITDGTNVISQSTYPLGNVTDWTWAIINYPCGSPRKVRFTQTETGTGAAVNVGHVTWSRANNLGMVTPQAELFATKTIAGNALCFYQSGSASYVTIPTDSDCNEPVITGAATTTAGKAPAISMSGLAPAKYSVQITFHGDVTGAGSTCRYRFTDGTTNGTEIRRNHTGTTGPEIFTFENVFTYSSPQATKTFSLQVYDEAGTGDCLYNNASVGGDTTITVKKWSLDSQLAINFDQSAASWSGYHIPTSCSWSRANAAYGDVTPDADCNLVETSNTGFGTVTSYNSGGLELPGITFTPDKVGRKYYACADLNLMAGTGLTIIRARLWDQINTLDEGSWATAAVSFPNPNKLCGFTKSTSLNPITLSLQIANDSGSTTTFYPNIQQMVYWTIFAVEQSFPAPVLFGGSEWIVDSAITGASVSLSTTQTASFAGIESGSFTLTNHPNALVAKIPCSSTNSPTGTTCSVGNESFGVNFDLPNKGWTEVCVNLTHQMTGNSSQALATLFKIVETPANAQTVLQQSSPLWYQGSATNTFSYNWSDGKHWCGNMYFSSAGNKTLRLFQDVEGGGTATSNAVSCEGAAEPSATARKCAISVRPLSQAPANQNVSFDYKETNITTDTQTVSADTYVDVTNATITLDPGTWDIGYEASIFMARITGGCAGTVAITDSSNVLVSNAIRDFLLPDIVNLSNIWPISITARNVVVSTSTTYKVRIRTTAAVAACYMTALGIANQHGALTDPDTKAVMWARKMK